MHESSSQRQLFSDTLESNSSSRLPHPAHHSHKDKKSSSEQQTGEGRKHVMRNLPRTKGSIKKRLRPINVPRSNVERRRRVRCHKCEPCTRDDCGECKYCKDMKKFGGTGVSKQCCLSKQCLQPLLPTTTTCMQCEKLIDRYREDLDNVMYECEICFEIYHMECARQKYGDFQVEPIINDDLKNCWQCFKCVSRGFTRAEDMQQYESANSSSNFFVSPGGSGTPSSTTGRHQYHQNNHLDGFNNSFGSGGSMSLNNSNSSGVDFNVSPSSDFSNGHQYHQSVKSEAADFSTVTTPDNKKRRRTKKEMKQSRSSDNNQIKHELDLHSNNACDLKEDKDYDEDGDELFLTVDTLTHFHKQVILREFCEAFYIIKSKKPVVREVKEKPRIVKQRVQSPRKLKEPILLPPPKLIDMRLAAVDRTISKQFIGEEIQIEDDEEEDEIPDNLVIDEEASSKSRSNSSSLMSSQTSMVANKSEQETDDTIFMDTTESDSYFYPDEESPPRAKMISAAAVKQPVSTGRLIAKVH
jgi:hypothetical protein